MATISSVVSRGSRFFSVGANWFSWNLPTRRFFLHPILSIASGNAIQLVCYNWTLVTLATESPPTSSRRFNLPRRKTKRLWPHYPSINSSASRRHPNTLARPRAARRGAFYTGETSLEPLPLSGVEDRRNVDVGRNGVPQECADKGGEREGGRSAGRSSGRRRRPEAVSSRDGASERENVSAASRSVGVADSNGRRSVSRLLRGSYVNMETGSWNPVLDSTYDSNQRG